MKIGQSPSRLVLFLMLFCCVSGSLAEPKDNVPSYLPGRSVPLPVGEEDYLENVSALNGLQGVYLNLDYVLQASEKNGTPVGKNLLKRAQRKLKAAGIEIYDSEEVKAALGQPELIVYPAFYRANDREVGNVTMTPAALSIRGVPRAAKNECGCASTRYWASFVQGGSTLRLPLKNYRISTWGMGDQTDQCDDLGSWMEDAVLAMVDRFIEDHEQAQAFGFSDSEVEERQSTACMDRWNLYLEIFTSGSVKIGPGAKTALNKFAASVLKCGTQHYRIETHADHRGEAEANEILAERRAIEVKAYLLARGVPPKLLSTRSYGEAKPVAAGEDDAELSSNRRVIIRAIDSAGN